MRTREAIRAIRMGLEELLKTEPRKDFARRLASWVHQHYQILTHRAISSGDRKKISDVERRVGSILDFLVSLPNQTKGGGCPNCITQAQASYRVEQALQIGAYASLHGLLKDALLEGKELSLKHSSSLIRAVGKLDPRKYVGGAVEVERRDTLNNPDSQLQYVGTYPIEDYRFEDHSIILSCPGYRDGGEIYLDPSEVGATNTFGTFHYLDETDPSGLYYRERYTLFLPSSVQ